MIRPAAALLFAIACLAACGKEGGNSQQPAAVSVSTVMAPLPDYVQAALSDPGRAAQSAADQRRKPGPLIAFSGVKPGDHVLDLIPGDGYWTRIFSKIVGPQGRVYAVWPKNYADLAKGNVRTLEQIAASPAYANVRVAVQPSPILTAPEPLDLVWTSQNYHDYPDEFMGHVDPAKLNQAVFAMLKPGGTFLIIDHAAKPGAGIRDTEKLHRIDPATVRQQVEAAGFAYAGASDVLRNPGDSHKLAVFDPSVRGRTDQFAMRFTKPARR
jgi:predicted methyltransferase